MNDKLTITITGGYAAGKTHLMKWLTNELRKLYWNIEFYEQEQAEGGLMGPYTEFGPIREIHMEPRDVRIQILHPDSFVDVDYLTTPEPITRTKLSRLDAGEYDLDQLTELLGVPTRFNAARLVKRCLGDLANGKCLTIKRTPQRWIYVIAAKAQKN